jgi:hypothetical protein
MFPEFTSALADAYVRVASAEIKAANGEVSVDAIHLVTEVDKSTAAEILASPIDTALPEAGKKVTATARVLLEWHSDRDYIGPYGLVRDLPFANTDPKRDATSFTALATKYCPSIPPKALLDELIRTGSVQDLGNGFYRAISRSYLPEQLSPESLRYFSQVVHRHIDTLEFNLRGPESVTGRRLDRTVYPEFGLAKTDLPAFDRYLRQRAQLFADDVDNWLTDRSPGSDPTVEVVQTGVSFYHYVANEGDEDDFEKAALKSN